MEKDSRINYCNALIIGGSAGSLEVILAVLPDIEFPISFPIIIVVHRKSGNDNILTSLFETKTRLKVLEIEEKQPVLPGNIYLAPSDYHILFEGDHTFSLDHSERVNYSRPSIDVAFQSASEIYGKGLTALLLSGANNDGVEGLRKIKSRGGVICIQNPGTAVVPYMPAQAAMAMTIDHILEQKEIAEFINQLSKKRPEE
ncbi:MAG: chemotaxis protein CheB [Ginsengibacter sp.]|jgi:two-component system chemotaxis response regulator CheB